MPSGSNSESLVWIDTSQANAVADGFFSAEPTRLDLRVRYQELLAIGKLSNTSETRSLGSSLSLTPVSLAEVRERLSRLDDLSALQPKLDATLRELGVTHRMIRIRSQKQPASFRWKKIDGTLPMCTSDGEPDTVEWKWLTTSSMELAGIGRMPQKIVVRQFSDGGWRCVAHLNESGPSDLRLELPVLSTAESFIAIDVPAGIETIRLQRKFLW